MLYACICKSYIQTCLSIYVKCSQIYAYRHVHHTYRNMQMIMFYSDCYRHMHHNAEICITLKYELQFISIISSNVHICMYVCMHHIYAKDMWQDSVLCAKIWTHMLLYASKCNLCMQICTEYMGTHAIVLTTLESQTEEWVCSQTGTCVLLNAAWQCQRQ